MSITVVNVVFSQNPPILIGRTIVLGLLLQHSLTSSLPLLWGSKQAREGSSSLRSVLSLGCWTTLRRRRRIPLHIGSPRRSDPSRALPPQRHALAGRRRDRRAPGAAGPHAPPLRRPRAPRPPPRPAPRPPPPSGPRLLLFPVASRRRPPSRAPPPPRPPPRQQDLPGYARDGILDNFATVNKQIQTALDDLAYDTFDMPEEGLEQVALLHSQFKRAATRIDSQDAQLSKDLAWALSDKTCDPAVLTRISEKLQLQTMADMKKESVALHEMVISSGGEPDGCVEEMSSLLKKLKDCVIAEAPTTDTLGTRSASIKHRSPIIPDEFRCPISLELMQDPVIVSSGQTYERSCIQKWLDSGHKTCPKTQQPLAHTSLTPNFVLKSLIAQWCEANGIELPKNKVNSRDNKATKSSDYDHAGLVSLMNRLRSGNQDEQRAAAGEIRLLAKRNVNNRICIAEVGAIPLLVNLLSSSDPRTQEHAVTALLNLSIHENNKASIVDSHAIPKIVEVLKTGSMEARENAAATLFSLSVVDENKVTIGAAGAIPPLINLLCDGSPRGKKDAATAIFNLCIYQGNKVRAVKAGIVIHLMNFLVDPTGGMIDEALTLLAILAGNPEGKVVIAQSEPIPPLVEVIKTGSPRNRENAAAILWSLCSADAEQTKGAKAAGADDALMELSETGTERAKRKASSILELMRQAEEA